MKKSSGQIVRSYSTALFEMAVETGTIADVAQQARSILSLLDPSLVQMFQSPRYTEADKEQVLTVLLNAVKAHESLAGLVRLVVSNRRVTLAKDILEEFLNRADTHLGICRVEVSAAHPLAAADLAEFETALVSALKKKIIISSSTDESMKAGYVVRIGNTVVDGSLRSRLARLRESLSQGV